MFTARFAPGTSLFSLLSQLFFVSLLECDIMQINLGILG
jgi:hypothetical protein